MTSSARLLRRALESFQGDVDAGVIVDPPAAAQIEQAFRLLDRLELAENRALGRPLFAYRPDDVSPESNICGKLAEHEPHRHTERGVDYWCDGRDRRGNPLPAGHVVAVGDPIAGVRLFATQGADDPVIERNFANDTYWVVPVHHMPVP